MQQQEQEQQPPLVDPPEATETSCIVLGLFGIAIVLAIITAIVS